MVTNLALLFSTLSIALLVFCSLFLTSCETFYVMARRSLMAVRASATSGLASVSSCVSSAVSLQAGYPGFVK